MGSLRRIVAVAASALLVGTLIVAAEKPEAARELQ